MADEFRIDFDTSELFAGLDNIAKKAGELVRPVAYAGAVVMYDEAKANAGKLRSKKEHYFYGTSFKKTGKRYLFQPGTLQSSIYHVFSKDNSIDGEKATYHISWSYKKCPYGFMVERGTSRAAAHPFLRQAYDSSSGRALEESRARFITLMEKSDVGVKK